MKKILIIGADIPMGAQITKSMQEMERGITILTPEEAREISENDYFKKESLKLSCFNEEKKIQPVLYEKPKSKFHK